MTLQYFYNYRIHKFYLACRLLAGIVIMGYKVLENELNSNLDGYEEIVILWKRG